MADEADKKDGAEGGAEASVEGGDDGGKAKKKKLMLIISSAVAVVGVLVAVGVVFFMGGEEKHEAVASESGAKPAHLVILDVPEFNLSLLSDDPRSRHFIKIKVALELAQQTDVAKVNELMPRLQDDWGGLLRQMRVTDVQGSANLHRLKENLLRRALQSLEPVEVKAVYIRELLVQ